MNELPNGLEVIAVSIMREGDTICTSVYARVPEGKAGVDAYLDALMACSQAAVEFDCPIIVEGDVHGG